MNYEIEFYLDRNNKSEVYDYIQELNKNNCKDNRIKLKKINMYMELLSKHGLNLGEPYIKKIDFNIWELRPLRDRILFATLSNNKFILLSIFMKQTEKTPRYEIDKAKRLFEDYIVRGNINE